VSARAKAITKRLLNRLKQPFLWLPLRLRVQRRFSCEAKVSWRRGALRGERGDLFFFMMILAMFTWNWLICPGFFMAQKVFKR